MKTRTPKPPVSKPPSPALQIETSQAILAQIADVDLFLARDIRRILESGPVCPQPTPTVQAYQPVRTSVTSA